MLDLQLDIAQKLRQKSFEVLRTSHSTETICSLVDIYARAVTEVEALQVQLDSASSCVTQALRAGMESLPYELVGTVFEHVSQGDGRAALSLSQANQRWRSIATTTPLVWNVLGVTWKTRLPWIDLIIARSSKFLVVEISLSNVNRHADQLHYRALCQAVMQHTHKWRQFTGFRYRLWKLAGGDDRIEAPTLAVFGIAGDLHECGLDISAFPHLTRLNFGRVVTRNIVEERCGAVFDLVSDIKCYPTHNLEYLSLFTNLERLKFWSCAPCHLDTPLILPTVKEIDSFSGCLDAFLHNLVAPNLREVSMDVSPNPSGTYSSRLPVSKFPNLVSITYKLISAGRIEWDKDTLLGMGQVEFLGIDGAIHLDETLAPLNEHGVMPNLASLELRNCQNVTTRLLDSIALRDVKPTVRIVNSGELFEELCG